MDLLKDEIMADCDIVYNSSDDGTFVVPSGVFRTVIETMDQPENTLSGCSGRTLSWGQV
jgi:hypothetical protein